jgi:putative hydrolase
MKNLLDVHTHTIVSGHAYSTVNEMIAEAQNKGLEIFGIVEHGPAIPGTCDLIYFKNMYVVPRDYGRMKLIMGGELNIIDYEGNLDVVDNVYLDCMEYKIAGLHSLCYEDGTRSQNTSALIGAIENKQVKIISHPCDGTASDFDIEAVVLAAKRNNILLELNNQSLNPSRNKPLSKSMFTEMLRYCIKHDNPIIIGSDAHHTSSVAATQYAVALIDEICFPEELIVNDKPDLFMQMIGLR